MEMKKEFIKYKCKKENLTKVKMELRKICLLTCYKNLYILSYAYSF